MIKPKRNFLITGFFSRYISWIIGRHFNKVEFNTPHINPTQSVLLIANHFSWWDGFILYHLNKILFKKTFCVMVLDKTMREIGFMKYLGAFSITKNSKQMLESLNYAAALLNNPDNMVVIFPQGKLYSNFVNDVKFEQGVLKIVSQATANFQYVFAASFTENFEHKKPTVYVHLKSHQKTDIKTPDELQSAYQQHYHQAKLQQTTIAV